METVTYQVIGTVASPYQSPADVPTDPAQPSTARGSVDLAAKYADGLRGLEEFSHVVLLAHLHRIEQPSLDASPPFLDGDHAFGVFATRSPARPNPIAQTVVRLRGIDGASLDVHGIDLIDGTPVLDVKPYIPGPRGEEVRVGWLTDVLEER
jgi:formylmethanofuran dehydrogenase subunit E